MTDLLLTPLRATELQLGVLAGLVALGLALGLTARLGARTRLGGLALGIAVLATAWPAGATGPLQSWIGLVLVAAAGVVRHRGAVPQLWWAPLVVGALLVTAPLGAVTSAWRLAATALGVAVIAVMLRFDETSPLRPLAPVLVAVAAAGMYATTPDTEQALVMLGAALPLAMLGSSPEWGRLGPLGAPLAAGLLLWVAASGGVGRSGAVVGGLACAGLLVCEPIARALGGRTALDRLPGGWRGAIVVVLTQLGVTLIAARVAGLQESAWIALALAVALLAAVVALLVALPAVGASASRASRARAR